MATKTDIENVLKSKMQSLFPNAYGGEDSESVEAGAIVRITVEIIPVGPAKKTRVDVTIYGKKSSLSFASATGSTRALMPPSQYARWTGIAWDQASSNLINRLEISARSLPNNEDISSKKIYLGNISISGLPKSDEEKAAEEEEKRKAEEEKAAAEEEKRKEEKEKREAEQREKDAQNQEKKEIQEDQQTQKEAGTDVGTDVGTTTETDKPIENSNKKSGKETQASAGSLIGGLGRSQPFIKVNNYGPFSSKELLSFELNVSGFYPTCKLKIETGSGLFLSSAFPKDGDLINVFIGQYSDTFKPIRIDFLITRVSTSKSFDREGDEMIINMEGIIRVPLLYADVCKAIKDVTSYEALFDIATSLKLGFASNEKKENLQDKQTWISPYISYIDWISNITQHAYRDDTAFYSCWIDQYSTLNFVNLNSTMSVPDDWKTKDGLGRSSFNKDHGPDEYVKHNIEPIMLTNERESKASNNFFKRFQLNNSAGMKNLINGYFRHLYFYDKNEEIFRDWEIKPSITKGASESKVVMQGRAGEDYYKSEKRRNYGGVQYSLPENNVHKFWKHSVFQNLQNLEFISKMTITLELSNLNPNLHRGQVLPVVFMLTQHDDRILAGAKKDDNPKKIGLSIDRFLSGKYTILGMRYNYMQTETPMDSDEGYKGEWMHHVTIGRREWTVPDNLK